MPVHEHESVYMGTNVSQRSTLYVVFFKISLYFFFFWEMFSHWSQTLFIHAYWLPSKVPGILVPLPPQHWDFRHTLYVGSRHPNLTSSNFVARALMTEPSPLHHKSNFWGWSRQCVYYCLLFSFLISDNRLLPNWMEYTFILPFVPFGRKFPHHKWNLSIEIYIYGAGIDCIHIHTVYTISYIH